MDEIQQQSGIVTLLKRVVLFLFSGLVTAAICYSCSAINTVSSYSLNINDVIGVVYETENQQSVLIVKSLSEATINTTYEELSGVYTLEQKANILFLTRNVKESEQKMVFVSMSEKEMLWQNKNLILYKWEEE